MAIQLYKYMNSQRIVHLGLRLGLVLELGLG